MGVEFKSGVFVNLRAGDGRPRGGVTSRGRVPGAFVDGNLEFGAQRRAHVHRPEREEEGCCYGTKLYVAHLPKMLTALSIR